MNIDVVAIIPARGGSKRLVNKNLRLLNNRPLVAHTIDAAINSRIFKKIILSSDSDNILAEADKYEGIEKHKRPDSLSGDTVKVIDLVLDMTRKQLVEKFDVIALLLPTCPFRTPEDLQKGLELLTDEFDSVVSLTAFEFPHAMATNIAEDGTIEPVFSPSPLITGNTRSQDHKPVYRPNGAFYMGWADRLLNNGNYFAGKSRGYIMPRVRSVDIDNDIDLGYAEYLIKNNMIG